MIREALVYNTLDVCHYLRLSAQRSCGTGTATRPHFSDEDAEAPSVTSPGPPGTYAGGPRTSCLSHSSSGSVPGFLVGRPCVVSASSWGRGGCSWLSCPFCGTVFGGNSCLRVDLLVTLTHLFTKSENRLVKHKSPGTPR